MSVWGGGRCLFGGGKVSVWGGGSETGWTLQGDGRSRAQKQLMCLSSIGRRREIDEVDWVSRVKKKG